MPAKVIFIFGLSIKTNWFKQTSENNLDIAALLCDSSTLKEDKRGCNMGMKSGGYISERRVLLPYVSFDVEEWVIPFLIS